MRKKTLTGLFRLGLCIASIPIADARTWTDATGSYKVEAEFVSLVDGKVALKGDGGRIKLIPLAKLSAADQAFAEAEAEKMRSAGASAGGTLKASAKADLAKLTMEDEEGVKTTQYHLSVQVDLVGGEAAKAFAIGQFKAEPAIVDGKKVDPGESFDFGYDVIERDEDAAIMGYPPNGVRVMIPFGEVPKETSKIDLVKGSVKVLAGGEEKDLALKDLLARPEAALKDPALVAAGLEMKFIRQEDGDDVEVGVEMDLDQVGFVGLELIGSDGKPVFTGVSMGSSDKTITHALSAEKDDFEGAVLMLKFRDGAKEVELPFEVKDVKVTRS